jgi:hypothetical protein
MLQTCRTPHSGVLELQDGSRALIDTLPLTRPRVAPQPNDTLSLTWPRAAAHPMGLTRPRAAAQPNDTLSLGCHPVAQARPASSLDLSPR